MKRFLIIAISIVSSISFATLSLSQTRISTNSKRAREIVEISPYDLVTASYQGRFVSHDIPAASRFISDVRANKIKARDLVKVAIDERRLSESTLNDQAYLRHVKSFLNNLDKN